MIIINVSGTDNVIDIKNLVKAFFQNQDVVVDDNTGIKSNTLMRKLSRDSVTGIFKFVLSNQDLTIVICDGNGDIISQNKQKLSNYEKDKTALNQAAYKFLVEYTGRKIPWGMMTGVHPSKPVLRLMDEYDDINLMKEKFDRTYMCSKEKENLVFDIAAREKNILNLIDYKNSYSLYIGIPFCPTTCVYCSFTSYSLEKFSGMVESYLEALFKEIEYTSTMITKKKLVSVYIGGGTPTSLNASQMDRLLLKIKSSFNFVNVKEFTVEAGRPDSIDVDKLHVMKKYGVTRISINPQSMNQKTLDVIGRKHSVNDIVSVYNMAREVGHDNINMDLIMGLPGENVSDAEYTLDSIIDLKPENVTVHTLALKRASSLNIHMDKYKNMLGFDVASMVDMAREKLTRNNYNPYYIYRQKNMADNLENTGYSIEGKECIYNILIMEEVQTILALGAGAVSKFLYYNENNRLERVDNVKSLKDYVERIDDMIEKKREYMVHRKEVSDEIF